MMADPVRTPLDWFAFSTRMQKMLSDLLASPIEQMRKLASINSTVEAALDDHKRRIDEHDFLLHKF